MYCTPARAIFLFGRQRSGTNLLFRLLCESLDARPFNEDNQEVFQNFRIRNVNLLNTIVTASSRPSVFKPVTETANFIEVVQAVPHARAILIFRNPLDVVLSSLSEFGSAMHTLTHDITYNFIENRLQDVGISLPEWRPIENIIDRYRGRFSVSADCVEICFELVVATCYLAAARNYAAPTHGPRSL